MMMMIPGEVLGSSDRLGGLKYGNEVDRHEIDYNILVNEWWRIFQAINFDRKKKKGNLSRFSIS